ncbi:hypothetical protein RF11_15203 [Thelohanellus kitauei]|uniref:Tc1-like transposase DDE domain-containing protein n=1 Tax=Thelohanellus kitauei TaxID=669202 RepID=A0A0C2J4F1_THEKT|nr:hypothetical protein RF11_15203 [Thelohanellus kitauei]
MSFILVVGEYVPVTCWCYSQGEDRKFSVDCRVNVMGSIFVFTFNNEHNKLLPGYIWYFETFKKIIPLQGIASPGKSPKLSTAPKPVVDRERLTPSPPVSAFALSPPVISKDDKRRHPEKSIAEVVRKFSLNERSLRYTYSKFLRDGSVIQNNQAGPKYVKVEDQHKLCIGQYIEENPIITIAQILSKLQEDFNLVLSKSTICQTIKKLKITYKLVRQVPIARNTPEFIEARRRYGRSQRGERARIVVANSRGRNITVCAAMNISGLVNYRIIVASFNKNEFCQFLRECFQKLSNTPKIFVMDNVRFHHSIEVRDVVESQRHRIVFFPPYSPQLNPIELLF